MRITVHSDKNKLGLAAANEGIAAIKAAIAEKGEAVVIIATGASQFEMLEHLVTSDIDFSKVRAFHLDEYVGLPITHGASFRKYLQERVIDRTSGFKSFTLIDGDAADLDAELQRVRSLIAAESVDVCFAGFGENCHLAFNDPPADFDTEEPYIVVNLDEGCRRQQMGEGWFPTLEDVPAQAVSMSVKQILKSKLIILSVPDLRKAEAVKHAVEGEVTNLYPASIVQTHGNTSLHLDPQSASLLTNPIA